jgi:hypothetical protein
MRLGFRLHADAENSPRITKRPRPHVTLLKGPNMNPRRYNPTGASMWMKNGERFYARWLPKDQAIELEPIGQPGARPFCGQYLPLCTGN